MKKRLFISLGAGLAIVLAAIALAPALLSTATARRQVLKMVNHRIPGHLTIDRWSLGWFSGIECDALTYEDSSARVAVAVDRITLSKGLLGLALNYRQPGRIDIVRPRGVITVPDRGAASRVPAGGTGPDAPHAPAATGGGDRPDRAASPFLLPLTAADIHLSDGMVSIVYFDKKENVIAKNIKLDLTVDGREKPVVYQVQALAGEGGGEISGQGKILVPMPETVAVQPMRSEADFAVKNWDMAALLDMGAVLAETPRGKGTVNGRFKVDGDPASGLHLTGDLTGTDIRLSGGPLKTDTPALAKISCAVDAFQKGNEITVKRLAVDSRLFRGVVTGRLDIRGNSRFQTEAALDLAEISVQLPATVHLKKGTRITRGRVALSATVETDARTTRFDGRIHMDRLAGISGKKKLSLDKPMSAAAVGSYGENGVHLDKFSVQSAFLSGKGQGDLTDLTVRVNADLKAALKEAGKFIDTGGWQGAGKLDLALHAGARSGGAHFIEARLSSSALQLQRGGKTIVPRHRLALNLKTDVTLDPNTRLQALSRPVIDFDSWLGKGRLKSSAAQLNPAVRVQQAGFDGTLALAPLFRMLGAMSVLPPDVSAAGKADIHTRFSLDSKRVTLDKTMVTIDRFALRQGKQRFADKHIIVHTKGQINLNTRSVRLAPVEITADAGNVRFPDLTVDDWADVGHGARGSGTVNFDLARLAQLPGGLLDLPEKTKVAGRAKIDIRLDLTDAKNQTIRLAGSFAPIQVDSDGAVLLNEKKVRLTMNLKGDLARSLLTIEKVALDSTPLSLTASGRIAPRGKEKQLSAKGEIAVDLEKLQNPINAVLGTDLELSGRSRRPFVIHFQTEKGQWQALYKRAALALALHADRIRGFGLTLKSVDMPVKIEKSMARSDIKAAVNGGELALQPAIDLSAPTPVLSLPAHSTILSQARITRDMANDLLALIHPVFKGTAAVDGAVDLVMDHFSWPLSEVARSKAAFSGVLKFNDVHLKAEGLIYDLLAVMKVKARDTEIGDRTIEFSCKNGRIRCSPLKLKVKDYRLSLSGSMGFDGTLDYMARIPVTPELVGKQVYAYLQDAFIDIPIGGTITKPKLNLAGFQTTLKKLIGSAAGKVLERKAGKLLKKLLQ